MSKKCLILVDITCEIVHTSDELRASVATVEQHLDNNQFPLEVQDYSIRFLPIDEFGLMTGAVGKKRAIVFLEEPDALDFVKDMKY